MEPCRGSDPGSNPGSGVFSLIPGFPGFFSLFKILNDLEYVLFFFMLNSKEKRSKKELRVYTPKSNFLSFS